jgi:MFS family permease
MTYRALLGVNKSFRRLWLGQVVSEIGDWLNNIAVMALVLQFAGRGHEGLAVAVYAIARHLPIFIFGPIAGVVVDRANRQRVMIFADLARALLALGFMFAAYMKSLALIYAVCALMFSISAFFNAAKRAAIPNLTSADELLTANSLTASTTAATIAVGSALGGLIASFIGRDIVFILNAATFLVSAALISQIRRSTQKTREHLTSDETNTATQILINANGAASQPLVNTNTVALSTRLKQSVARVLRDFRDGLRYVRRDAILFPVFIIAAGWGLGNGAARALYSVFGARLGVEAATGRVAHPTDFGISILFVAMGLGGVIGAPVARRANQNKGGVESLGGRMGRAMFFDGAALIVFTLMPNLWLAATILVAREINFAIWWTAQQTILMRRTHDRFGGRVFASFETLTTLMMVGAMLASGAAADTYGIRLVAAIGGSIIAFSGLLWFALRRQARENLTVENEKLLHEKLI